MTPHGQDRRASDTDKSDAPSVGLTTDIGKVIDYVMDFEKRVMQDAFTEAESRNWTRRADSFEKAMARPGDYVGNSTPAEREARRLRLTSIVLACRQRASVSMFGGVV